MTNAPQYAVQINGPGKGFFVLRMKDKESSYWAKEAAYLNVQANDGQLINAPNKKKQLGVTGPSRRNPQPIEVEFSPKLRYPYTYTALVSHMKSHNNGEGGYSLAIFSKDLDMKIKKMN